MVGGVQSGQVGGLRVELAADLGRGAGLHVPDINVAGAAEQIDQDARLGLAKTTRPGLRGWLSGSNSATPKAQGSSQPDSEAIPSGPTLPQIPSASANEKHGPLS